MGKEVTVAPYRGGDLDVGWEAQARMRRGVPDAEAAPQHPVPSQDGTAYAFGHLAQLCLRGKHCWGLPSVWQWQAQLVPCKKLDLMKQMREMQATMHIMKFCGTSAVRFAPTLLVLLNLMMRAGTSASPLDQEVCFRMAMQFLSWHLVLLLLRPEHCFRLGPCWWQTLAMGSP